VLRGAEELGEEDEDDMRARERERRRVVVRERGPARVAEDRGDRQELRRGGARRGDDRQGRRAGDPRRPPPQRLGWRAGERELRGGVEQEHDHDQDGHLGLSREERRCERRGQGDDAGHVAALAESFEAVERPRQPRDGGDDALVADLAVHEAARREREPGDARSRRVVDEPACEEERSDSGDREAADDVEVVREQRWKREEGRLGRIERCRLRGREQRRAGELERIPGG